MQDELNLIEEYASLFFTVSEIALMIDADQEEFRREIRAKTSPRAKAYYKGRIKTEIEMRRSTKQFAEKGSPQAEALMNEFGKKQKLDE
jgi:hypothetical protein